MDAAAVSKTIEEMDYDALPQRLLQLQEKYDNAIQMRHAKAATAAGANKGGDAEEGAQAEKAALDSAIAEVAAIYLRPTDIEMREELAMEWEQGGSTAPMEVILARGRSRARITFKQPAGPATSNGTPRLSVYKCVPGSVIGSQTPSYRSGTTLSCSPRLVPRCMSFK